jgi:hypothetical protein
VALGQAVGPLGGEPVLGDRGLAFPRALQQVGAGGVQAVVPLEPLVELGQQRQSRLGPVGTPSLITPP